LARCLDRNVLSLRRGRGLKRGEKTADRRKLHNGELHDLYSSTDIIWVTKSWRMRSAKHVACMGERKHPYRGLVRKYKGKRPLGISRGRWEDDIVMNLKEIGLDCVH